MSFTALGAAVMMAFAGSVAELPSWLGGAQWQSPTPPQSSPVIVPTNWCIPGYEPTGLGRCAPDCRGGTYKRVRVAEEQTRFRDAQGRTTGTATPEGSGTIRYRDAQGRSVGTATTGPDGTTRYYGPDGRSLGSSTGPARAPASRGHER